MGFVLTTLTHTTLLHTTCNILSILQMHFDYNFLEDYLIRVQGIGQATLAVCFRIKFFHRLGILTYLLSLSQQLGQS